MYRMEITMQDFLNKTPSPTFQCCGVRSGNGCCTAGKATKDCVLESKDKDRYFMLLWYVEAKWYQHHERSGGIGGRGASSEDRIATSLVGVYKWHYLTLFPLLTVTLPLC
jgi:hypothetical protein